MRAILLVLCIFNVTLPACAQFGKNWQPGSYYDTLGHKTTGLIAWSSPDKMSKKPGDHIFYKSNEKASKERIESSQFASFTMGSDTFVVSRLMAINYAPIMKVELNTPIKLYYWSAQVTSWGAVALGALGGAVGSALVGAAVAAPMGMASRAHLYGPDAEHLQMLTNKNFIPVMCEIMADKPEVVEKIKSKQFKYGKLNELITYYTTGALPEKVYHDDY